jgi:hypothetical protein
MAGCSRDVVPEPSAIGNLSPEQMGKVRQETVQFEQILDTVRKADVSYAVEPRFYPTV